MTSELYYRRGPKQRRLTAIHEVGHAFAFLLARQLYRQSGYTKSFDITYLTIIPRGDALGHIQTYSPDVGQILTLHQADRDGAGAVAYLETLILLSGRAAQVCELAFVRHDRDARRLQAHVLRACLSGEDSYGCSDIEGVRKLLPCLPANGVTKAWWDARWTLQKSWAAIDQVAFVLEQRKLLTGAEMERELELALSRKATLHRRLRIPGQLELNLPHPPRRQ